MKGFNTSKDYATLYSLIQQDFRVPAWIVNKRLSENIGKKVIDLVEVKMGYDERYIIGVRGIGYESFDKGYDVFADDCNFLELEYIIPNQN